MIISVGKIFGGVEKYTIDLASQLPESDYNIFLVVRNDGVLFQRIHPKKNLKIIPVRMDKRHIVGTMLLLKRIVKDNVISVVHCNSNNGLFVASFISRYKKIAVIHGDVISDQSSKGRLISFLYKYLEVILVSKTALCICVSESLSNIMKSRGVKKTRVVYNGIHVKKYMEAPDFSSDFYRIASVGNLLQVKNQGFLVELADYLRNKYADIKFLIDIYGEGPERESIESRIKEKKLENYVHLKGFDKAVRDKLNKYQLYVQPSLYESFGIAVLEAANAGCYVLASNVGGMTEVVHCLGEYLFDVDDCETVANTINYCYLNKCETKAKAEQGQEKVGTWFSLDRMITEMDEIYRNILK